MDQRSRTAYFEAMIKNLMGPIADLYDRDDISEIMINGPNNIYIEDSAGVHQYPNKDQPAKFHDAAALESLARAILQFSGKSLSAHNPSVEAYLPNDARVHIVLHPAATNGTSIAIRRPSKQGFKLDTLRGPKGSLTKASQTYLEQAILDKKNIIVSGGTSSGKTALLNAMVQVVPERERLITIEDVPEIFVPENANVVSLTAQLPDSKGRGGVTIGDLFRAALRMRPDRILVGECRGPETLDMLQAMNSGHAGSQSTVHADTPSRALSRLETLCLMDARDIPIIAIRRLIIEAIDVIVQVQRIEVEGEDGQKIPRRVITHISEIGDDTETGSTLSYAALTTDRFHLFEKTALSRLERVDP